ncbi:MAG: sugar phosphate isomerase/epimerase [Candidatus Altiarchaeota archaeon]
MMIGVSTRVLWVVEENLALNLDYISKVADAAELWMMPPFFPSWRQSQMKGDLDRLKDVLTTYDLETTIHAPCHDLNISSLNPAAASCAAREVMKCLEVADLLGSKAVTFHPGKFRYHKEKAYDSLKGNLRRLDAEAKDRSCLLCVENMAKEGSFLDSAKETVEALTGLDNVHVTLDIAHMLLGRHDPAGYVEKLGSKIVHAHISDFKAGQHAHLPIGQGSLDLMTPLRELEKAGYSGMFVLEGSSKNPHTSIPEDVKTLKRMLADAGFT